MKNSKNVIFFFLICITSNLSIANSDLSTLDDIVGIEIILANGSDQNINTKFGHAFLRLVDNDDNWQNDTAISFAYEITENKSKIEVVKEVTNTTLGKYPLVMKMTYLGDLWTKYELAENRNLSRLVIPTNETIRANILSILQGWQDDPTSLGQYTLFNNNCIGKIEELLKDSGIPLRRRSIVKPSSLPKYLLQSNISFMAPIFFTSKQEVLQKLGLTTDDREYLFTEEKFNEVLNSYSDDQLRLLLAFNIKINNSMIRKIVIQRGIRLTSETYQKIIGAKELPKEIYELCTSTQCTQEKLTILEQFLGASYITTIQERLSHTSLTYKVRASGSILKKEELFPKITTDFNFDYEQEFFRALEFLTHE